MDQKRLVGYAKYGLETLIKENENAELIAKHYGNDKEEEKIHNANLDLKKDLVEVSIELINIMKWRGM